MKHLFKILFNSLLAAIVLTACEKAEDLPFYENGTAPAVTASASTIAPIPADSLAAGLILNWTNPAYAADSATYKYIVEIDRAGNNFAQAAQRVITGSLSTTYLNKELNNILIDKGLEFGTAYDMEVRVISSYSNNNERLISNVLPIKMTPYKIPPRVELPSSGKLFLVGSATGSGWNNPVQTPEQEFTRLDETTFAGVFNLKGGNEYLVLPVNGLWDQKYSVANKNLPGLAEGGDFGFGLNDNIPGPAADGMYKIVLDFQAGKFIVTPYTENNLPSALFMVGDATPGGWNNPVPTPSQQFTRLNSSEFELTLELTGGKQYLFLPVNGDWSTKYSVQDNTLTGLAEGGSFGYNLPQNFPGPATDGTYKINVNFATSKFSVVKQ
ncbi:SusE domain-containing protein [Flavihumibacter sp. RY-1]|uniref:SusE domain-containing protein n=1 Tax=Flavihumibacter fluminis TaxID=2909236 RepID=A0ABS9BMF1_9BACT|nr:SusE domain-containing protein [Flavihumibacter fluminis]MCF1715796.1 SusE domain-containing protein [Flavihumibacter fluminis]